jgi:hypothetical protein
MFFKDSVFSHRKKKHIDSKKDIFFVYIEIKIHRKNIHRIKNTYFTHT